MDVQGFPNLYFPSTISIALSRSSRSQEVRVDLLFFSLDRRATRASLSFLLSAFPSSLEEASCRRCENQANLRCSLLVSACLPVVTATFNVFLFRLSCTVATLYM